MSELPTHYPGRDGNPVCIATMDDQHLFLSWRHQFNTDRTTPLYRALQKEKERRKKIRAKEKRRQESDDFNPRVEAWLNAVGLTREDIERNVDDSVRRVIVNGEENLWTVFYMAWISRKWEEWARSLGYKKKDLPWRDAIRDGHTAEHFDKWLGAR